VVRDARGGGVRAERQDLNMRGVHFFVPRACPVAVSFPSRQFVVHGERRSFSLLRWVAKREAQERLQAVVRDAYRGGRADDAGNKGTAQ